jgi:serine/threonine protein kinase
MRPARLSSVGFYKISYNIELGKGCMKLLCLVMNDVLIVSAFGVVYGGTNSITSSPVAIKILNLEQVERKGEKAVDYLRQEIEIMRELSYYRHENILTFLLDLEKDGFIYLVLEHCALDLGNILVVPYSFFFFLIPSSSFLFLLLLSYSFFFFLIPSSFLHLSFILLIHFIGAYLYSKPQRRLSEDFARFFLIQLG